jgi:hypothetical protein
MKFSPLSGARRSLAAPSGTVTLFSAGNLPRQGGVTNRKTQGRGSIGQDSRAAATMAWGGIA